MLEKSLTEYAYEVLQEEVAPISFSELFKKVPDRAGLTELTDDELKTYMTRFYTSLTIDGKFFNLNSNQWDLRYRYPEKIVIESREMSSSDEDEEESKEETALEGNEDEEFDEESNDDEDDSEPELDYDHKKTSDDFSY